MSYVDGTLRITPMDDRLGLSLSGALDQNGLAAVRSALAAASAYAATRPDGPAGFALDLTGLDFISVAGLRVLILATCPEQRVRETEVVAVSAPLRRLLHLTRWDRLTHWLTHVQPRPAVRPPAASSGWTGRRATESGVTIRVKACSGVRSWAGPELDDSMDADDGG
ncbi:STAS domain-containing protein [Streptosporangiaceae bacterium NEAU-GS5]|nr:STAS domain-containing protein [Streptosporangiaceae bacterium NEAU-GS5]